MTAIINYFPNTCVWVIYCKKIMNNHEILEDRDVVFIPHLKDNSRIHIETQAKLCAQIVLAMGNIDGALDIIEAAITKATIESDIKWFTKYQANENEHIE